MSATKILGILNLTEDSSSDGGRYFDPGAAIAHAHKLVQDGADLIDLGPASSHPDSKQVDAQEEIARLEPVVASLIKAGVSLSVDSWRPETHAWALAQGVAMLNDIRGFPHPPSTQLRESETRLVVMHSIRREARADRSETRASEVLEQMYAFFDARILALTQGGIARKRLILDPGLGYFLGSTPPPSLAVLGRLAQLRERFGLEVMISASRKSFLGALTGREVGQRGAATLSAELWAARHGASWIRTHDPRALRDALLIENAIRDSG